MSELKRLRKLESVMEHLIRFILDNEAFEKYDSKVTHEEQLRKEHEHKEAFAKFLHEAHFYRHE